MENLELFMGGDDVDLDFKTMVVNCSEKNLIKELKEYNRMRKKVLTPEEITSAMEERKKRNRGELEKKVIKATRGYSGDDIINVFSNLISKITT